VTDRPLRAALSLSSGAPQRNLLIDGDGSMPVPEAVSCVLLAVAVCRRRLRRGASMREVVSIVHSSGLVSISSNRPARAWEARKRESFSADGLGWLAVALFAFGAIIVLANARDLDFWMLSAFNAIPLIFGLVVLVVGAALMLAGFFAGGETDDS